ncbi:MAG: hypothetical protein PHH21_03635 [Candidatus Pacebacteria bacterium]|nr:hypothetical protein [Candidatus Paceibacterota bacterium]
MEFTIRQLLAWVLIIIGLGIVFWDISSSYYYFTAQEKFPQVFRESAKTEPVGTGGGTTIQDQVTNVVKDQIKQMVPENTVTQLLNIGSWIVFASFILWAGGKLIGIGNDFLKNS